MSYMQICKIPGSNNDYLTNECGLWIIATILLMHYCIVCMLHTAACTAFKSTIGLQWYIISGCIIGLHFKVYN